MMQFIAIPERHRAVPSVLVPSIVRPLILFEGSVLRVWAEMQGAWLVARSDEGLLGPVCTLCIKVQGIRRGG